MRDKLLEMIPEFSLIQDAELKEKTLQAWETALDENGWTPEALAKLPFTLLINPCPASFIEHVRAVTLTAIRSAEVFAEIYGSRLPVNMDLIVSGGLLHDIGKLYEYENRADGVTVQTKAGKMLRHPFTGMALAARFDLPAEIQHIIATHAGEGDKVKRTTEATIINHSDFVSFHSLLRQGQKKELAARME